MKYKASFYFSFIILFLGSVNSGSLSLCAQTTESNDLFNEKDLQLDFDSASDMAIRNSFELQQAANQFQIALLNFRWDIRKFLPMLTFSFTDARSVQYDNPDTGSVIFSLELEQPLFTGGAMIEERKLSRISLSLGQYAIEKTRNEIMNNTWTVYYQYVILLEKLQLQKELYALFQEQLIIAEKELELGSMLEVDFVDSQLKVQSVLLDMKETENEIRKIDYQFRETLNIPDNIDIILSDSIDPLYAGTPLNPDPLFYFYIAKINNLDLMKSRFQIEQAQLQYRFSRTSFIPEISFLCSVSFSGENYPMQNMGFSFSLNIAFTDPIFPLETKASLGKTDPRERNRAFTSEVTPLEETSSITNLRAAKMNLASVQEQYLEMEDTLLFEIEQTLISYTQKQELIKLKRERLVLYEKKYNILSAQIGLGEAKRVDLLESGIEMYDLSIEILEDTMELLVLERQLETLCGLEVGDLDHL